MFTLQRPFYWRIIFSLACLFLLVGTSLAATGQALAAEHSAQKVTPPSAPSVPPPCSGSTCLQNMRSRQTFSSTGTVAERINAPIRHSASVPQLQSSYSLPDWWRPCQAGKDVTRTFKDQNGNNINRPTCAAVDTSKAPVQCDGYNYQRYTTVPAIFRTSWRGIAVCGPEPDAASTYDNYVQFQSSYDSNPNASWEQEFECAELVKRYLLLAYGLPSLPANGSQVVDKYTAAYPILHKVVNNDPRASVK